MVGFRCYPLLLFRRPAFGSVCRCALRNRSGAFRMFQDALADGSRTVAPSGVELPRLPRVAVMLGENFIATCAESLPSRTCC